MTFFESVAAPSAGCTIAAIWQPGRGLAVWIACLFVAIATDRALAQIHFDDFASSEELSLVGDARVSGKVLRITPAKAEEAGAFWFREKQSVGSGFDTMFQFQLLKNG